MRVLFASIIAVLVASSVLPACKKESPSATFSGGGKKSLRKPASIDRSKAADIGSAAPASAVTRGSFTVWTVPKDPQPAQDYQVFIEVRLPQGTANYKQSDLRGKIVGTDGYEQSFGEDTAGCDGSIKNDVPVPSGTEEGTTTGPSKYPDATGENSTVDTRPNSGMNQGSNALGLAGEKKSLTLEGCSGGLEDFQAGSGHARLSVWVPGGGAKVRDTIDVTSTLLKEHQSIGIEF